MQLKLRILLIVVLNDKSLLRIGKTYYQTAEVVRNSSPIKINEVIHKQ